MGSSIVLAERSVFRQGNVRADLGLYGRYPGISGLPVAYIRIEMRIIATYVRFDDTPIDLFVQDIARGN
jgi:hypothetical protein